MADCPCCGSGTCACDGGSGPQCGTTGCDCGTTACPCGTTCCQCQVVCCQCSPINDTLSVTVNWIAQGLCVFCSPPITFSLTFYAAGTGPLGTIPPFTTTGYWYGCTTCGTRTFNLVFYCEGSPTCTWFMETSCFSTSACPSTPTSGPMAVSVSCNPFSVVAHDAACCGSGNTTTITIT